MRRGIAQPEVLFGAIGIALLRERSGSRVAPERILTDLIAQLPEHCREPSCNCDIGRAADYAETRLRRLRDD